MKYSITNKTHNTCRVTLIPETPVEETLLKNSRDQDTFMFHYMTALEKHISPDATFINLMDDSSFPSPVTVRYQIAKGIAN